MIPPHPPPGVSPPYSQSTSAEGHLLPGASQGVHLEPDAGAGPLSVEAGQVLDSDTERLPQSHWESPWELVEPLALAGTPALNQEDGLVRVHVSEIWM